MRAIFANIDHEKVGCGERLFVVVKVGYKWVRLFYPSTLTGFTIPREQFDRLKVRPADPVRTARLLRKHRKLYSRLGLNTGGASTKSALKALTT